MSKDGFQSMKAFPKRQHFLASSYLIVLYNKRPVKFLYKLFTKCFTEDKARLEHFGIRCGRRVQKTLGQVNHFLSRTSITRLSFPSNAAPDCCLVWFGSAGPFEQNPFIIDLLGVHTGMGLRATPSQPLRRKEKATQWVSLGWVVEQSRASHLPLKTLSPLLPNIFSFARTRSYFLIKVSALEQKLLL